MNKDELKQLCDKFIDDLYGLDDYPNKERLVVEAFARALVVRGMEEARSIMDRHRCVSFPGDPCQCRHEIDISIDTEIQRIKEGR
jgi:hypothetical protein